MRFFLDSKKVTYYVLISFSLFIGAFGNFYSLPTSLSASDTKGYSGAFVVPYVIKNRKTYILVGRESGGKDKGLYCVPGGSSGFWIFRDVDPLDTASREFCEETLISWDFKKTRAVIASQYDSMIIVQSRGKKIVAFVAPFEQQVIDDIVYNFSARRAATWFWQYHYREMDHYALVEWNDLMSATTQADIAEKGCVVKGLVFDAQKSEYKKQMITVRPILVSICKEYQKDNEG